MAMYQGQQVKKMRLKDLEVVNETSDGRLVIFAVSYGRVPVE